MPQADPAADGATPFRILHIGKFYPPDRGGMETYLADLMRQQRDNGIDARALVHGQPQPDDPCWLRRLPVQIRLVFTPIALGFPWAIRSSLRQFQPDVLHLHMPNVAVFWLLLSRRARRVPWVVHWHSDVTFSRTQKALALAYRLYRPFERAVLAQARFIIATSPPYLQASDTLRAWRSKCVAIPLGLQSVSSEPDGPDGPNDAGFNPAAGDAAASVPRAGQHAIGAAQWRPGKLRVLSVGRLTYYKGFETLVRAVAALPWAQLKIVGNGDLHNELQALIDSLAAQGQPADVELLGGVSEQDKHLLLASCDVFALASRERTEAFGLALLEAMQFGKPCVVSDLQGSGMPWLVRESGAGVCVAMEDVPAWQQALEALQADPVARSQLGLAGKRAAHQLFSIGANGGHVRALYASLVPEYQPGSREDRLIAVPVRSLLLPSQLNALARRYRALGQGDLLLINEASDSRDFVQYLSRWGQQQGVVVVHTPHRVNRLNAMQTAMRWALRQGYASLLHVPAELACDGERWPLLADAIAAVMERAQRQDAELIYAMPAAGAMAFPRWASRWFAWLTGTSLRADFSFSLQLYRRSAMQKAYQLRLSLLDQPEMGLLLLARQAAMPAVAVALPELTALARATQGRIRGRRRRTLEFVCGGTLMYLAKWRKSAVAVALPPA